jgi:hypothetical protein
MQQQQQGLVTPDFSQCQDEVSPGIYRVRIVESKVDTWEGKDGKPNTTYIAWTLETFGEHDDKNNGRKIFHRTPIEGKGAFRFRSFYKAAMGEDCAGAFDPTVLYGREVEVTVAPQTNAPEYNEVKAVKQISQH